MATKVKVPPAVARRLQTNNDKEVAALRQDLDARRQQQQEDDLENLMNHEPFRRVVDFWLEEFYVDVPTWEDHANTMARNVGKQEVGLTIRNSVVKANFPMFLKMMAEKNARQENELGEIVNRLQASKAGAGK